MQQPASHSPVSAAELAEPTVATVKAWLKESTAVASDRTARRLAALQKDPQGLEFARSFIDQVIRPHDRRVAARNFERLSRDIPSFFPLWMRILLQLGGGFAVVFPWLVLPIAHFVVRREVSGMVLDAEPKRLDRTFARLRGSGTPLDLAPLGSRSHGRAGAASALEGVFELLGRVDVDHVTIRLDDVVGPSNPWAHEQAVADGVTALRPLFEFAASAASRKHITLDVERSSGLWRAVDTLTTLLEEEALQSLEAGITLPAYLPESLAAHQHLTEWATRRRAGGGAGITVRLLKGSALAAERIESELHDWPLATSATKLGTDAQFKRILDWAMTPERMDAVRLCIATQNLFDLAHAKHLAEGRRVTGRVEYQMLLGVDRGLSRIAAAHLGGVVLWAPVETTPRLDGTIDYLVHRLEEGADAESFASAAGDIATDASVFRREKERYLRSLTESTSSGPASNRVQDRLHPEGDVLAIDPAAAFSNTADSDPTIAANREWAKQLRERAAHPTAGRDLLDASQLEREEGVESLIEAAGHAAEEWAARPLATRAATVHEAGAVLAAYRSRIIEVLLSETATVLAEADAEASRAVDLAHHYAAAAVELEAVENARFVPGAITVIAPSWSSPVSDTVGAALAAIVTGSAVIVVPAHQARRSAAVAVEALRQADIPDGVVTLAATDDPALVKQLLTHDRVDRVIFAGERDGASAVRSWRPERVPLTETSGLNSIIVTPGADLDLAIGTIITSALERSGQSRSAVQAVILVDGLAEDEHFIASLVDAVESQRAGSPTSAASQLTPLIEPAYGRTRTMLTELTPNHGDDEGAGEEWLVKPKKYDTEGSLWSAGLVARVLPGSRLLERRAPAPVLGIVSAASLEEAVELQNSGHGSVAGLLSLDVEEVAYWVDHADNGNLFINRPTTGAKVGRQPWGGWYGATEKSGGPDFLLGLGRWQPVFSEPEQSARLHDIGDDVRRVIEAAQPSMQFVEFDLVRAGAVSDEKAWAGRYGITSDSAGLAAETNALRYLPVDTTIRLSEGSSPAQLVRVIAAAARAGARVFISSALPLPPHLIRLFQDDFGRLRVEQAIVESDARWLARVQAGEVRTSRIRLIGGDRDGLAVLLAAHPEVGLYAGPVTTSGRIELLAFLRAQTVSMTAHRHGHPDQHLGQLEF